MIDGKIPSIVPSYLPHMRVAIVSLNLTGVNFLALKRSEHVTFLKRFGGESTGMLQASKHWLMHGHPCNTHNVENKAHKTAIRFLTEILSGNKLPNTLKIPPFFSNRSTEYFSLERWIQQKIVKQMYITKTLVFYKLGSCYCTAINYSM